jgi:hypothetical protein
VPGGKRCLNHSEVTSRPVSISLVPGNGSSRLEESDGPREVVVDAQHRIRHADKCEEDGYWFVRTVKVIVRSL